MSGSRSILVAAALTAFAVARPDSGQAAPPETAKPVLTVAGSVMAPAAGSVFQVAQSGVWQVQLPTAVGRPASDLVMLVDNGPVVPTQGVPNIVYTSFARVHADGTLEPGSFVVPAGKVLVLTSASGGISGPPNAIDTLTLYAWAQPDGALRGLYGNNFRTDDIGFGDVRIDFGSGFALAAGQALLLTSPIANVGLNFQGYLAPE